MSFHHPLEAQGQAYDLLMLDLMLPGMDGLEICRRLWVETDYVPILMLTATARQQHDFKKQAGGGLHFYLRPPAVSVTSVTF